jgi:hypothetical protein
MLAALFASYVVAQTSKKVDQSEQTIFGSDAGSPEEFTRKPVEVPGAALQVIRDSFVRGTLNCLKHFGTTPDVVPASWFVASEIHLDGPDEIDLIVRPNVLRIAADKTPLHEASGCMLGANVIPFWVLRNTSGRYGLLLETHALELEVLDSRSNFYRDIPAMAATAVAHTTVLYKMSDAQYQFAERKTEPNWTLT